MEEQILVEGRFNKKSMFRLYLFVHLIVAIVLDFVIVTIFSLNWLTIGIVLGIYIGCFASASNMAKTPRECYLSNKRFYYNKTGIVLEAQLEDIVAYSIGVNNIVVKTKMGRISVNNLENAYEFSDAWKNLDFEKKRKEAATFSYQKPNYGSADELKKYKELLDSGVITQEEFDAKKKQLLGL